MNLLVANVPVLKIDSPKSCDTFYCCDTSGSCDLPISRSCDSGAKTQKINQHYDKCFEFSENESKNRTCMSEGVNRSCDIDQEKNTSVSEHRPMEITETYSGLLCQNAKQFVIFTAGDHNVIAVHEVTAEKQRCIDLNCDNEEGNQSQHVDKLDHIFTLKDCYITGLCLSHDQRYVIQL